MIRKNIPCKVEYGNVIRRNMNEVKEEKTFLELMHDGTFVPWRHTRLIEELDDLNMNWMWELHDVSSEIKIDDSKIYSQKEYIEAHQGHVDAMSFTEWWFSRFTEIASDSEEDTESDNCNDNCERYPDGYCLQHDWDHILSD
jgi:hypothetical protein